MAYLSEEELRKIKSKYRKKIEGEFEPDSKNPPETLESLDFQQFREELRKKQSTWYEKACNFSEKLMRIKPDKVREEDLAESIRIAHLNISPAGAVSFGILGPIMIILVGGLSGFMLFQSMYMLAFFFFAGISLIIPLGKLPHYYAATWRMKASNQMVQCVFYIVTYMRHTSNLEKAIEFASDHLLPPLSYDLKKVLWNVETEEFESVKESLDEYLESWRKYNMEFIEAFHLIESSLYESSNERRLLLLDKSLDVLLDETYEKMLHYAHNLKTPITTLHMLGIILPILGLVILPLVVSFMQEVRWYHISMLYNVALPFMVYFMGKQIMITRPTGYGETDISQYIDGEKNGKSSGKKKLKLTSLLGVIGIFIFFFGLGISPLIIHLFDENFELAIGGYKLLDYKPSIDDPDVIIGPYGIGSSLLSFGIPAAFAFSLGMYYRLRSQNVVKMREEAKKLEKEFAGALFQLGNRLGDGIPAEIAFGRVAEIMEGTVSGNFFLLVSTNIRKLGMGVESAIFHPKIGAMLTYPSSVIESSMKVLIQSIKKGPAIAAQALLNVSRYIKEIHRVDERLKDLMADTISSMKSQINFLTPVIAGVVIGITSMITSVISKLGTQLRKMGDTSSTGSASLAEMFGDGMPTYYFQIIVGIYVVQICYILTGLANTIENGTDKVSERYTLGKNMIMTPLTYIILAIIVMMIFNLVAGQVIDQSLVG